jgi:hypothetical protein
MRLYVRTVDEPGAPVSPFVVVHMCVSHLNASRFCGRSSWS